MILGIYLPTFYLGPSFLPTYLSLCLPFYLPSFLYTLSALLPIYIPTLLNSLRTFVPTYLHTLFI